MEDSNACQMHSVFCYQALHKSISLFLILAQEYNPHFLFGVSIALIFITSNLQKEFCFSKQETKVKEK